MRSRALVAVLVGLLGLGVSGCASRGGPAPTGTAVQTEQPAPGDIPDDQAYLRTAPSAGGWSVSVPEGWSERTTSTGFVVTDKLNSIAATQRTVASAPTVGSVRASEVAALRRSEPGFSLRTVEPFTRTGGTGVRIVFVRDSAVDPVTSAVHREAVEQYLFTRGTREVVLVLAGPVAADDVDPWRIVSDSFRWAS